MSNDDGANAQRSSETGSVKIFALLGLAQRAGYLTVGFDAVCNLVKDDARDMQATGIKSAKLKRNKAPDIILIAKDISDKTEKELRFHVKNVPVEKLSMNKEELSKSIGLKSLVGIIAVSDGGFAKAIKKHM